MLCDSALIAGSGQLPAMIVDGMLAAGKRPLVLDISGGEQAFLASKAGYYQAFHPLEFTKGVALMKQRGVLELTMAGRVPHSLLMGLRPHHLSFEVMKLWWGLPDTRADTVLEAIANYFHSKGIPVVSSLKYITHAVLSKAHQLLGRRSPSDDADILLGIVVAKTLGLVDVGQSVIVRKGTVIALEGMEGTDACLERAIVLGSEGATFVKLAKPDQDLRFDVPTIGEGTFERLRRGGFRALVVQERATICTDLPGLKKLQESGIELIIVDDAMLERAFKLYGPKEKLF